MRKKKTPYIIFSILFIVIFIIVFVSFNRFEHFKLSKEPDMIFSSPYTDKLAVVTDGQLTIYDENGKARKINTDFDIRNLYPLDDVAWVIDVDGNLYELTYKFVTEITISDVILKNIKSIECTPSSFAAINTEGELYVWGDNKYCTLGIPEQEFIDSPTRVTNVDNVIKFKFQNMTAILLGGDGHVYHCGLVDQIRNDNNEIENIYTNTFIKIEELSGVKDIYGDGAYIALYGDSKIAYWFGGDITEEGMLSMANWDDLSDECERIGLNSFSSGAKFQLGMTIVAQLSRQISKVFIMN